MADQQVYEQSPCEETRREHSRPSSPQNNIKHQSRSAVYALHHMLKSHAEN